MNNTLSEPKKFEAGDDKAYEVKTIINSAVYGKEANNQIPGLYYLILQKGYSEDESTWKPSAIVMYL